jgi:hypothetical protein
VLEAATETGLPLWLAVSVVRHDSSSSSSVLCPPGEDCTQAVLASQPTLTLGAALPFLVSVLVLVFRHATPRCYCGDALSLS